MAAITRACWRATLATALSAATLFGYVGTAAAQDMDRIQEGNGDGMDLHLFRPPLDSKGLASVNGADVLGAWDFALGLFIDYGHDLMPLNDGHEADVLVEHSFQGTFSFNLGFLDLFLVGLSAPVTLSAGDSVTDVGPTGNTYNHGSFNQQSLGHVALHTKFRILPPQDAIGLAAAVQVGINGGEAGPRSLASEPGFWYWPQAIVEKQFFQDTDHLLRLALNVGYRGHTGENPQFGEGTATGEPQLESGLFEYGNLMTGSFGVSLRVLPPLDLLAETYMTALLGGDSDSKQRVSAEAIGGIKVFVEERSFLFLAAGAGYTPGFQTAGQRGVIGFVFEPSIPDADGDGIPDGEDECPTHAEDRDGFEDEDGCPDPDNDGDGIPDVDDDCPNNPEDFDGDRDEDGCPEVATKDRDGDGIIDALDSCPDEPEDFDSFKDEDGCPDPDNDNDGIPDVKDQCPNDPEDKDRFQDEDGCPDPDNDKDGIPDVRDQCPDQPEDMDGDKDEDGCPDDAKIVFTGSAIMTLEKINFATASAKILPQSLPIVDEVAKVLKEHPNLKVVEVGGHADERGSDATNRYLTQARAASVMRALVGRGIQASRLRSVGYGEYCPIDPDSTPEAWEKNRRVEFKVLVTDKGATNVDQGCEEAEKKGIKPPKP
ncbi:MAG: OmpA family protein [Deltaproteobacteria bacterium]|jgi:outer membrane protein OmpA-like peptidoglycan-associated protein|nr:OmpA family protein [Deltaproteobacteria bacterium]MBW2531932.1 OmpA family protein [Deltaproteobacteria bacterium]